MPISYKYDGLMHGNCNSTDGAKIRNDTLLQRLILGCKGGVGLSVGGGGGGLV